VLILEIVESRIAKKLNPYNLNQNYIIRNIISTTSSDRQHRTAAASNIYPKSTIYNDLDK